MKEFWDERYASEEFAYGDTPNEFFKEQIDKLEPGRILLPADGEGRNGVYAATKNWEVQAFDISKSGKQKADELARLKSVDISFNLGPLESQSYKANSFDVIALIFAHFPSSLKDNYHENFVKLLKPDGRIIFEAFSKDHLKLSVKNPRVGGPKDKDILYSIEEIKKYFKGFQVEIIKQEEVNLQEGKYHNGLSSVVRFVGVKK